MKFAVNYSLAAIFIVALFLSSACSIGISQTMVVPTRLRTTPTKPLTGTSTPKDRPPTQSPPTTKPGDPTVTPTPSLFPTEPFAFTPVASPPLEIKVMPDYPQNLRGRLLLLISLDDGLQALFALELRTGEVLPLFVSPPKTWILSQSISPNGKEILLSYAPPSPEGKPNYGYTDLYLLSSDRSFQEVLPRTEDIEAFLSAFFSSGGDYIYYTHYFADPSAASGFRYNISRIAYPIGTPEVVVENAYWQRLSPDGTKLAYITYDERDFNELFVANAAGSDPARALDPDEFPTVDAPFFSPDNQYLYFSAVSEQPTSLAWWEKLIGMRIAFAHNVPSDFWRVSLLDGGVEQVTDLQDQGMFGTFSPDGQWIAFTGTTGLSVMHPDGSSLVQVLQSSTIYGTVEWIP